MYPQQHVALSRERESRITGFTRGTIVLDITITRLTSDHLPFENHDAHRAEKLDKTIDPDRVWNVSKYGKMGPLMPFRINLDCTVTLDYCSWKDARVTAHHVLAYSDH